MIHFITKYVFGVRNAIKKKLRICIDTEMSTYSLKSESEYQMIEYCQLFPKKNSTACFPIGGRPCSAHGLLTLYIFLTVKKSQQFLLGKIFFLHGTCLE